jgi:hypothetical protein
MARLQAVVEASERQAGAEAESDASRWSAGFDALAEARATSDARLAERLDRLDAVLNGLAEQTPDDDGNAWSADQLTALADGQTKAGEALQEVLREVRRRDDLGGVQRQLTDLALLTGSNRERLEQLVVKVDGDRVVDQQLARLATRLEAWPQESQAQLGEVLAAVREQGRDATQVETAITGALRDELASLRDWLPDRETLQREVRTAVAAAAPMVVPTSPDAVANASARPMPIGRVRLVQPERGVTGDTLLPHAAENGRALSATEHGYRVAFQTGQPVTVGAGELDPVTGKVSAGRVLDPAAAREAGYTTWTQWYAADMFAERMRRQRAATRHLQVDQQAEPIRLPGE